VDAVGAGVAHLRPGDEVYGEAYGAFAEYVTTPSTVVDRKPANLSFAEAAALPLAANTALMGLRDSGRVRPGQRVLINGASGGVGLFAVQVGKWLGADVTGVCSSRNVELVDKAGADDVIDYTRSDFARVRRPFDVVFDLVGNRSLADLRRVLTPAGTLVLSGGGVYRGGSVLGPIALFLRAAAVSRFLRHRIEVLVAMPSLANLTTLRELAEAETLTPSIDRTYPLAQAGDAIRYLETEHARAKVILTM
jgi:NADPH:quinone reductase-like Zn-dependent oxidoreductase